MFSRSVLFSILMLLRCFYAFADETPVLLLLKKSEQVDTLGCNFVEQVTSLVYKEIMENRVKLWDSPEKAIQLTAATLKEIEKNTAVSFTSQETIFMYETWENNRKEIATKTLGFSFVNRSSGTEEVSFGYVDYKDLNELFLKTRISSNASGNYSSTYTTYVLGKKFIYNIVQFGNKPIKSLSESEEIKNTFIRNLGFNSSMLGYYPPDKYISYIVDTYSEGTDVKSLNSQKLRSAIEDFLVTNQEVFFNMGGDRFTSHIQRNKLKVTRIELNEMWRKINGEINYEPKSMTIFVNDSALNEMSQRAINDMEIDIDGSNLGTFLKNKNYNFIITKINSQPIKRKDSYLYLKGLLTAEWNKVIEYVINY
jgi:hypothetical protein